MRKSNWIFYIIALVVSAFLLWLWYWLGFDHVDAPFDLVLSIIWWMIVAIACFSIHRIEKKRRERMRTCYLGSGLLYNSEAGSLPLPGTGADDAVDALRDLIGGLEYGFDIENRPEDEQGNPLPFALVVRSKTFELEKEADGRTGSPEKLNWQGEVAVVARPDDDPLPFESIDELRTLMRKLVPALTW